MKFRGDYGVLDIQIVRKAPVIHDLQLHLRTVEIAGLGGSIEGRIVNL